MALWTKADITSGSSTSASSRARKEYARDSPWASLIRLRPWRSARNSATVCFALAKSHARASGEVLHPEDVMVNVAINGIYVLLSDVENA